MKKFLSMLLAVLMVVGVMVPTLTFFVGAEGAGEEEKTVAEIPELIITELCMNAYGNTEIYSTLDPETTMPLEKHYQQVNLPVGTGCSSYFEKSVDGNGVVTFKKTTDSNAVEGKVYYWESNLASNHTEIVEYFEVYNASAASVSRTNL